SVPVTIFGPLRAAIYVGQAYIVFNSTEHIRVLTHHFDSLIRGAVVQPTDVPAYLRNLKREIG
ncbi:MAG: transcriptional regulator, partial [Inquilinus sp.]|nr:transcriptional regulator [Inquilinus sp.]